MINHFVNLVGWREITDAHCEYDRYFADTQTMALASRMLAGRAVPVLTGSIVSSLLRETTPSLIVHSGRAPVPAGYEHHIFVEAPPRLVDMEGFSEQISAQNPQGIRVFLGISSPKQNRLARTLAKLRPELEIFCIGAVIDDFLDGRSVPAFVRAIRSEWLYRALQDPRRAATKLRLTGSGMFDLFRSKDSREAFRSLADRFCEDKTILGV